MQAVPGFPFFGLNSGSPKNGAPRFVVLHAAKLKENAG
jgi:hypothetical protein